MGRAKEAGIPSEERRPGRRNDRDRSDLGRGASGIKDRRAVRRRVLEFALGLPGAYEDHPWDETVVKVNKKVFVFLGVDGDPANFALTVKLADSHEQALMVPGAEPTGYGLGRAGWVTVPFRETTPPVDVLTDWVEESYRIVAPRRLVAELDE